MFIIKEKIYSICNINIAYLYLIQGPAGPIGAPGIRGEDGNPGPRVRDVQACSFYFFSMLLMDDCINNNDYLCADKTAHTHTKKEKFGVYYILKEKIYIYTLCSIYIYIYIYIYTDFYEEIFHLILYIF